MHRRGITTVIQNKWSRACAYASIHVEAQPCLITDLILSLYKPLSKQPLYFKFNHLVFDKAAKHIKKIKHWKFCVFMILNRHYLSTYFMFYTKNVFFATQNLNWSLQTHFCGVDDDGYEWKDESFCFWGWSKSDGGSGSGSGAACLLKLPHSCWTNQWAAKAKIKDSSQRCCGYMAKPLQRCTQGEREEQQTEAAEVQRWLLVHLCHGVQRHAEQQHCPRERWPVQEGHQDGAHRKVACMCNACPHGCQA